MAPKWISLVSLAALLGGPFPAMAQEKPPRKPEFVADDRVYVGLNFSPDGTCLASTGEGFVAIWGVAPYRSVKELKFRGLIDEAVFDPSMRILVVRGKVIDTVALETPDWTPARIKTTPGVHQFETAPPKADLGEANVLLWNGPVKGAPTWGQPQSGTWSADRFLRFAQYPLGSCPAAFDAEGQWLALANGRNGIRLWAMNSYWLLHQEVKEYPDFAPGILGHANAILFHSRYLFLGEDDGSITPLALRRWEDLANAGETAIAPRDLSVTRRDHAAFSRHEGPVASLSQTPDGRTVFSAGLDEKVHSWHLDQLVASQAARPEWTVPGHFSALTPDGGLLAVAEEGGTRVYDGVSREKVEWLPSDPKSGRIVRLRWNPTGTLLAVLSCRCDECVPRKGDDVSLASYRTRPKRVHQHGGRLEVYSIPRGPGNPR